jgi:riboflavin kinase / FMN adenylyltransferase
MRVYRGIQLLSRQQRCLVIGNLDGVHRGHQALLHAARAINPAGLVTVLTFEPHPKDFFKPGGSTRLMRLNEKLRALAEFEVAEVVVVRFNERFAAQSGEQFAQVLKDTLRADTIVVGEGFRFGHRQGGDIQTLQAAGLRVECVATYRYADAPVSSTRVRAAMMAGQWALARTLLGHPLWLRGRVFKGQQLGRQLGFPTANLHWFSQRLPLSGIFAVRVRVEPVSAIFTGVASLGARPTVNGRGIWLEVHLFDYSGDLYGRTLSVELVTKLREELKFDSLEQLTEQMQVDAAQARAALEQKP